MKYFANRIHRPRSHAARKLHRAQEKNFQRTMKQIMDDERPDITSNPEAMDFIQKYQAATSNKVKSDLRDLWREAACDFEMAGRVLTAKKEAFKETITEGSWMSEEQLVDELKSKEHTKNFMEFCSRNKMERFDPKLRCRVCQQPCCLTLFGYYRAGKC